MSATVNTIARYLLGVTMLVFGVNKFFHFMPNPELPGKTGAFIGTLVEASYIFPILGICYLLIGLLLVLNKAVLLALVMFNIVAFHLFLAPSGILFAAIIAILNLLLLYANWNKLNSLFN